MKPGRELDALIAEKIMGWSNCQKCEYATWLPDKTIISHGEQWRGNPPSNGIIEQLSDEINPRWYPIKNYSTDIHAAFEIVDKLMSQPRKEMAFLLSAEYDVGSAELGMSIREWYCEIDGDDSLGAYGDTPMDAICKAALLTISKGD